jgi:mitogen-activated protein kinase 15
MFAALMYLHSAQITHRDIKPSNILINKTCVVKLADFGLARCMRDVDTFVDPVLTDYVATRWYRAPEILLGTSKYDTSIDMWGLGCVIAELYISKPLFPGSSTLNQL